ncbi:MAG: DUF4384 domain-containing protein [Bacteroidetes bacterium]|nr:DUF4384 domain-containing protein [Bacteroidota bacterium]
MTFRKLLLFASLLLAAVLSVSGQARHSMGAVFNKETIAKTPRKVQLSFQSFRGMPEQASLEQYCPTPGDQGDHGTCVAFANGYGIATLLYAKAHDITDKSLIDKFVFSPTFLYELIKDPSDADCQMGTDPIKALLTMVDEGTALIRTVPYSCGMAINEQAKEEAAKYKISDASILFGPEEFSKPKDEMIELTKKALLEGSPVSCGFHLPESFFSISTDVWTSNPDEADKDWKHNGHAMAVVGYDDNKAGGAFRVLNSWGTSWADHGYVWMKYDDFARYCILALQVFGNPSSPAPVVNNEVPPAPTPVPSPSPTPAPSPAPVPAPDLFSLSGSVDFKLNTGEAMPVNRISSRNLMVEEDAGSKEDLVAYTMQNSYTSGTRFRFYLNIDNEAYIYAFATDLGGKVNRILPYDDLTSTHVGGNSIVAFPSDTKVIRMDENKGTDYLLILYSKSPLDMNSMLSSLNASTGALSSRIVTTLGDKLIPKSEISHLPDVVGFSVNKNYGSRNLMVSDDNSGSGSTKGTVVPLMIEIKHN